MTEQSRGRAGEQSQRQKQKQEAEQSAEQSRAESREIVLLRYKSIRNNIDGNGTCWCTYYTMDLFVSYVIIFIVSGYCIGDNYSDNFSG